MFLSWLHLLALMVYLGAVMGFGFILLPTLSSIDEHEEKVRFLARGLKLYSPLQTGALGVLVLSGAFRLTDLKDAYREFFLKELGVTLGLKLALAFVLIMMSVHQTMAVGHRFVRRHETGESILPSDLQIVASRLRASTWPGILLAACTAFLGIRMHS